MLVVDTPGIPDMKQVDLHTKYREFVPDELHHLIYPKPSDDIIAKIKDYRRLTATKRLEKIKMMKDMKVIVDDVDNDIKDVVKKNKIHGKDVVEKPKNYSDDSAVHFVLV